MIIISFHCKRTEFFFFVNIQNPRYAAAHRIDTKQTAFPINLIQTYLAIFLPFFLNMNLLQIIIFLWVFEWETVGHEWIEWWQPRMNSQRETYWLCDVCVSVNIYIYICISISDMLYTNNQLVCSLRFANEKEWFQTEQRLNLFASACV